jgi:hypothetical protein
MVRYCLYCCFVFPSSSDDLCRVARRLVSNIEYRRQSRTSQSLSSRYVFAGVFGPILLIVLFVVIVSLLQNYAPKILPKALKTWSWLPRPLRSLGWYDEHLCGANRRLICCNRKETTPAPPIAGQTTAKSSGQTNSTFDNENDDKLSSVTTHF